MSRPYTHQTTGRSLRVWIILAFCLVSVFGIESLDAPPFAARMFLWGLLGLTFWIMIYNPVRGLKLTDTTLTLTTQHGAKDIKIANINHLNIREANYGAVYTLRLRDGSRVGIPSMHFRSISRAIAEFEARGIEVRAKVLLSFQPKSDAEPIPDQRQHQDSRP